ncbi:MAG: ATP-binding cassette domain-containing protein, partial [Rhodospirillales bacterium]|nr:ATP-binding cassette domain-containing protein [Rhodospirillales bacterium]
MALRIDVVVGEYLFDKFMAVPLHLLESKPANYWQSLFRDADTVRNTLSGATALLVVDLPFAVLFLVVILLVAMPVAWVLMVILPIYMFLAWRSASVMASANKAERDSAMTRDSLVAEMIGGRTTIKALALGRAIRPLWENKHAQNIEQSVTRGAKTDAYSNLGASLTMVTSIAMTAVGAIAIIGQGLTMGALIAANMLSGRLLGPLNQLVGQWRTYNSFRQSVERLGELFNTEGERLTSEVKLDRPKGEIVCESLTFTYAKNLPPICDNISITIKAGGIHALVGRNGSGKTTLLKMIQGLYTPTSGRVLLDDADISQFTREELARWMGYVPQECVLFAGSVRDNIIHRFPDAKNDDILRAATASGAHQFIIDLPDGYASDIGEAGRRLSGGQRQRIAIARALLGDPAVLLLDEPSSSFDRQAEQELRQTLVQIAKERTVVVVTHSPILLAACDDLVALDKGKVALAGPSKEILPRLFGAGPKPQAASAPTAAPVRPQVVPSPAPALPAAAMAPAAAPSRPAALQAPRPLPPPPSEQPAQPVPLARPAAAQAQALRPPV